MPLVTASRLLLCGALCPALRAQAPLHSVEGIDPDGRLGQSVASLGDIDGDGVGDYAYGTPQASSALGTGRVSLVSGATHAVLATVEGLGFFQLGASMDGVGDADLDGVPDLIVGAPATPSHGWATLVSGALLTETLSWQGSSWGDEFGYAVAGVGDVNFDGGMDFAVGAPQGFNTGRGYVRVISGTTGAQLQELVGGPGDFSFGRSLAAAQDWTADGVPDLAVASGASLGHVRVFSGADGSLAAALSESAPVNLSIYYGEGLRSVGDLDGDGEPELALSAPVDHPFGHPHSVVRIHSAPSGATLRTVEGTALPGSFEFGASIAAPGDYDGDGVPDLAIGSPNLQQAEVEPPARVSVHSGATGAIIGGSIVSEEGDDAFGRSLAALSDLDGDGLAELLIGAPRDSGPVPFGGAAYVHSSGLLGPLRVPLDYVSIQQAVEQAKSGDVVLVAPGLYEEAIDFQGKPIRVAPEQGTNTVVLRPPVGDPAVRFVNGEGADSVLEGFVIVEGNAPEGGGVHCLGSSPVIRSCTFRRNRSSAGGGAVGCGFASPQFEDCRFEDNLAPLGGAVGLFESAPLFVDCEFHANRASLLGGAVWGESGSAPSFERCSFAANLAPMGSGALHVDGASSLTSSILWGDAPAELAGAGSFQVSHCDVEGGAPGPGNLNVEPLYYDTKNGVLFLRPGSPCIDAGLASSAPDPDGSLADMGAIQPLVRVVPEDAATIQQAINSAADGEVVYVRPGIYNERISVWKRRVLLCGEERATTVLELAGLPTTFSEPGITLRETHLPRVGTTSGYSHVRDLDSALVQGFCVRRSDGVTMRGLQFERGHLTLRDVEISGLSTGIAPAAWMEMGYAGLEGCVFRDNVASGSVGAVALLLDGHVRDSWWLDNSCGVTGGALRCIGDVDIVGCVFAGNSANIMGALHPNPTTDGTRIERCTFAWNLASAGGAAGLATASGGVVRSSIFWANTPGQVEPCICTPYPWEFDSCNVQGGAPSGGGNLDEDPLFLAPELGDYRLASNSPSLDSGSTLSGLDPDGSLADQGALPYEPPGAPVVALVTPSKVPSLSPESVLVALEGAELHLALVVSVDGVAIPAAQLVREYDPIAEQSVLHFPMPPVSKLGPVDVVVTTPWGAAAASIQVDAPAAPLLVLDEAAWPAAAGVAVRVAAQPGDLVFFALSPDLAPTLVPGVLSADIGANLSSLVVFASATLDASGVATAQADTSAFAPGTTLHFQAALLEAAGGGFPLATTNVESGDAQ